MEWKFCNLTEAKELRESFQIIKKGSVTCPFCREKGNIDGGICPVCSGKGKNKVFPPLIFCRRCKGWGSYPMNSQSPCTTCKGIGAVSVRLPLSFCPICDGRGDTSSGLSCTKCGGKGVVTGLKSAQERTKGSEWWGKTILMRKK